MKSSIQLGMTKADYLEKHIPHRINLLLTFRERFEGLDPVKTELVRDLMRCSKDISILMVRFLLGEVGITLKKGERNVSKREKGIFTQEELSVDELTRHNNYESILETLKAANRAVAHMEDPDVDHVFTDDIGDKQLFTTITYTESVIIKKIYKDDSEFKKAMEMKWNQMHRDRIVLSNLISELPT